MAILASEVAGITALNAEVDSVRQVVVEHFDHHPEAELITSLPVLGVVLGARMLGEFGDDALSSDRSMAQGGRSR